VSGILKEYLEKMMSNEFLQGLIIVVFAIAGTLFVVASYGLYLAFKEPIKDE
jgi:succinate dehydrogenase hydrophobic anchor subunit